MLHRRLLIAVTAMFLPFSAYAAEGEEANFIGFASEHCRAFIQDGRADLAFALGNAAAKFSSAELMTYNKEFAAMLVRVYGIDPAQGCVLDVVSKKPAEKLAIVPTRNDRRAAPKLEQEIAVVAGVMKSAAGVPVSVAYRMERVGNYPWIITNISLNGQPLVDRYREEYEELAERGGSQAVLQRIAATSGK